MTLSCGREPQAVVHTRNAVSHRARVPIPATNIGQLHHGGCDVWIWLAGGKWRGSNADKVNTPLMHVVRYDDVKRVGIYQWVVQ